MLTINLGKGMVSGVSLRRGKDRLVMVDMGLCGSSSEDVLLIANQSIDVFFSDREIMSIYDFNNVKKIAKKFKKIYFKIVH